MKFHPKNFFKISGSILVIMMMTGCEDNNVEDLQNYMKHLQEVQKAKRAHTKSTTLKAPQPIRYQVQGLRSPFESEINMSQNATKLTPLQSYPVNMLQFLGTVSENGTMNAYVMAPDKILYKLKVGDEVGNQHGKVIYIDPVTIKIEEQYIEEDKAVKEVTILQLKDMQ